MPFDLEAARQAGKSDEDIAGYLGRTLGFDVPAALAAGKTPTEIAEYLATNERPKTVVTPTTEKPGFLSRTASRIGEAYTEATTPIQGKDLWETVPKIGEKVLRIAGKGGEIVGDALVEGAKRAYNLTTTPTGRETIKGVGSLIADSDFGQAQGQTLKGIAEGYGKLDPRTRTNIEAGLNATMLPAGRLILPAVKEGVNIIRDVNTLTGATGKLGEAARSAGRLIKPAPSEEKALKQVLQGDTKDLFKGKKALSSIDTTGVKTYEELAAKLDEAIPVYARQVDAELAKDARLYQLNDLKTIQKTKGGANVENNYVQDAIDNLKELYEKTGDNVSAGNMKEILAKAQGEGLTKKEVNDLARVYGSEFKTKAFSKKGDPLTSVNAQAYENVRTGLKEVARRGLSDTAKELDSTMSSLYNTRRLIDDTVEKVNDMQGKVDPRSPLEKVGRLAVKGVDTASGGMLRGIVGGMLPRGVGNKVFNALDLEEKLARNLKIINAGMKSAESTPVTLQSATGRLIADKTTAGMEESLNVMAKDIPAAGRLVQAGPVQNENAIIMKNLENISKKVADLEAKNPPKPNIVEIQKALQKQGVPFMKQFQEAQVDFENRIIKQYQRNISPEIPTIAGKETKELKALREQQAQLGEKLMQPETTPKAVGGIKILEKSIDSFHEDPQAMVDALVDLMGAESEKTAIVLRGIYKGEIGKKKLSRSSVWEDGEPTRKKLSGTSGVLVTGNWEYTPARIIVDEITRNALKVKKYGDSDYIAVVKGNLLKDEIFNDVGEAVVGDPEVIAYIKKSDRPNPSRPGGRPTHEPKSVKRTFKALK